MTNQLVVSQEPHGIIAGGEDRIEHRLVRFECRVLGQISHDTVIGDDGPPRLRLFTACDNSKEGGLAGAVQSYDSDFVLIVETEAHALEQRLRTVTHAY